MKKIIALLYLSIIFSFSIFTQTSVDARTMAIMYGKDYEGIPELPKINLPELVQGIWAGDDRYIFFVPSQNNTNAENDNIESNVTPSEIAILLKTYYGWFYDRAVEPDSFSKDYERFLCTATTKEAEKITITAIPLQEREIQYDNDGNVIPYDSGAWELVVKYGNKVSNETRIPIAIIGNNLYLDFLLKDKDEVNNSSNANELSGFWQGICKRKSFQIAPYPREAELTSYYITDDAIYNLRYWATTMPFSDINAAFSDGEKLFNVPKHIVSSASVFTCVTGRSSQIRNVEKTFNKFENYTLDSTGTICAFGKPYLTKVTGENNAEHLMQIVAQANSRRKPDPPPIFPPNDLNWHWDLITLLEKDNTLVQEVRKRQKAFAESNGKEGLNDAIQASMYSTHIKLQQEAIEESKKAIENNKIKN